MSERTVLIAVDGSEQAKAAFTWYCENVYKEGDKVEIVTGVEYNFSFPLFTSDAAVKKVQEEVDKQKAITDKLMAEYTSCLRDKNMKGEAKAEQGKPGEAIIKRAEDSGAQMIVIGTRGLGKLRRTVLGSVSDYVVHHSTVPVIVVRNS